MSRSTDALCSTSAPFPSSPSSSQSLTPVAIRKARHCLQHECIEVHDHHIHSTSDVEGNDPVETARSASLSSSRSFTPLAIQDTRRYPQYIEVRDRNEELTRDTTTGSISHLQKRFEESREHSAVHSRSTGRASQATMGNTSRFLENFDEGFAEPGPELTLESRQIGKLGSIQAHNLVFPSSF